MAQKLNKDARFQAVTANRLIDGEVVYFTEKGAWSLSLGDAVVADGGEEGQKLLDRTAVFVENRTVVEPYLFEVGVADDGTIEASSVREKIRARGPTVRLDLGKQAAR